MNQETLSNQIEEAARSVAIIWSTLEAIYDALQDENCVPATYYSAVRGTADYAYNTKNRLTQMLIEINQ